ncbi:TPM domain-containing protein [Microbulbifer sp.]|uniref:TPM domain-containing protein n=1 Tax=Microbulbifer sp. TaxID=1908541 RepID=UPI003F3F233B
MRKRYPSSNFVLRFVWLLLFSLMVFAGCAGEPRWLRDPGRVLNPEQADYLQQHHRQLLEDHDIDYRVVISASGGDMERRALALFSELGAGQQSGSGRGLLLLLDTQLNQVRIEVSQSLEGVYPDAFVAYLEHRQMVPFFRHDRVADGIAATTELVVTRAQEAARQQAFDPSTLPALSGGAGARTAARLGEGEVPRRERAQRDVAAADTPAKTVERYLQAMARRNDRIDLAIYTRNTREMLKDWVMTPAQMDSVARAYRDCGPARELRGPARGGDLAVVRYPLEQRQCSPWFLRREERHWRLDLAAQQQLIGFGRDNQWHLNPKIGTGNRNPWFFGFMDWSVNRNGFPMRKSRPRWALSVTTNQNGTFVRWVGEGSPAERLGFEFGDQLLTWNGEPVKHSRHVAELMHSAVPGEDTAVEIQRGEQTLTLAGSAPPRRTSL